MVNEEIDHEQDFISNTNASKEVKEIIKETCYDCHSNQPKYPWYAKIAPLSWWINDHIQHGRKHLNFSEWNSYSSEKKVHKLEECWQEVNEEEMPLYSYTIMHGEAQLSDDQIKELVNFFKKEAAK